MGAGCGPFELVGVLLGLFIVGVLIDYSWEHAMRAYDSGDSSIDAQYLLWPSKMIVSISLMLLWLRLLVSLWGYPRLLARPEPPCRLPCRKSSTSRSRRCAMRLFAGVIDLAPNATGRTLSRCSSPRMPSGFIGCGRPDRALLAGVRFAFAAAIVGGVGLARR